MRGLKAIIFSSAIGSEFFVSIGNSCLVKQQYIFLEPGYPEE
jgi:hypothetical protein